MRVFNRNLGQTLWDRMEHGWARRPETMVEIEDFGDKKSCNISRLGRVTQRRARLPLLPGITDAVV